MNLEIVIRSEIHRRLRPLLKNFLTKEENNNYDKVPKYVTNNFPFPGAQHPGRGCIGWKRLLFLCFCNAFLMRRNEQSAPLYLHLPGGKSRREHPGLSFRLCGAAELEGRYDLLFSNACLQWIPDHASLLPTLMDKLEDGAYWRCRCP